MLVPRVCVRLGLRDVAGGSIGPVIFFRKRLRVVDRELAIQSNLFSLSLSRSDRLPRRWVSRQPGWGTQVIYDSCVGGSEI